MDLSVSDNLHPQTPRCLLSRLPKHHGDPVVTSRHEKLLARSAEILADLAERGAHRARRLFVNRRQFLTAGTTMTAMQALQACTSTPIAREVYPDPVVTCSDNRFTIEYAGGTWVIDGRWFGDNCKVRCKPNIDSAILKMDQKLEITATGGTFPGLDVEIGLRMRLYYEHGRWLFGLVAANTRFTAGFPLADWLTSRASIKQSFSWIDYRKWHNWSKAFGLTFGQVDSLQLQWAANWCFEINSFEDRNDIVRGDFPWGSAAGTGLRAQLVPLLDDREHEAARDFNQLRQQVRSSCVVGDDGGNAPAAMVYWLTDPVLEGEPTFNCGTRSESLSLHESDLDEVTFVTYGNGSNGIAVSLTASPGGIAACDDRNGERWFSGLPLDAWTWHDLRGDAGNDGVFNASVARQKSSVKFHGSTLRVDGRDDIDGPFSAKFCDKVCDSYLFTFNMYEAYLAMHDVDFSCLHATSIVEVSLDPVDDHDPGNVTTPTMWSSDGGSFRVPLGSAALSVLRADDFVKAKFTFKNLDLKLFLRTTEMTGQPEATIELYRGAPDSSAPDEAQTKETGLPLLAVELPPQYVAEQAFFRQIDPGHRGADLPSPPRPGKGSGAPGDLVLDAYLDNTRQYLVNPDGRHSPPIPAAAAKVGTDVDIKNHGVGYHGNLYDELRTYLNNRNTPSVETRLAGTSRLVFEFGTRTVEDFSHGEDNNEWRQYEDENLPLTLTFSELTNFDGLRPAVNPRALDRDAPLLSQLAVAGLRGDMDRASVPAAIAEGIKKPDPFETSIEIVYRLQVSPSGKSRWVSGSGSAHPVTGMTSPWHITLQDGAASGDVRAIWSPDFDKKFITGNSTHLRRHPVHSNQAPWVAGPTRQKFRMSLDARDRHELVALTSVYGLPALPRIDPNTLAGEVEPDENRGLSAVVPGPEEYEWLTTDASDNREGFYVPRPLDQASITLTGYGAFAELQGAWEPPAAISKSGVESMWPAFTVERWKHDIVMGRDIDVEIVYKGFLFPLGYRASLVKTTQRRFDLHPRYNYPIAVLIQRMFIVVSSPIKNYPAIGQMFAGRGWHCNTLELLTTRSPDVVDPFDADRLAGNGNISKDLDLVGAAFWPRVRETSIQNDPNIVDHTSPGNEVRFKYRLDDDASRTESPLLFVDNTAAHNPKDMAKIHDYYDKLADVAATRPYITASFEGQRIAYAESLSPGDTTFETFSWLLGAKGREPYSGTASDTGVFYMDAIMEGADQPPFYPFMKTADIRAQSIAALSGNGTGRVRVAYDDDYLNVGFGEALGPSGYDSADRSPTSTDRGVTETQKNPSQIYLLVAAGPPPLDFSSNGSKSGGVAKPNLTASALSRSQGVVGGSPTYDRNTSAGVAAFATTQTPLNGRALANAGLDKAKSGNFDPGEFFGGALADAKLLGLIKLQDILKVTSFADAAPQLLEEVAYSLPIEEMVKSARVVVRRLLGTIKDVESQLDEVSPDPVSWRSLYPELGKCVDEIKTPLNRADMILARLNGNDDNNIEVFNDFVANLNGFMGAIKALSAEVNRIVKNPIPVIISKKINELKKTLGLLRRSLDALGGEAETMLRRIGEQLRRDVANRMRDGFRNHYKRSDIDERAAMDYIATYLYGKPVYLGKAGEPIEDALFSPPPFDELGRPNLDALRDALLYDTVGKPLMRAFETLRRLDRSKQDTLKILGEALIDSLEAVSELDEVQRYATQIEAKVSAQCEALLAPLTGGLQASVDAVSIYIEDVRVAFKRIIEIDPAQVIGDVTVNSYIAANGVKVQTRTTIRAQEARDALKNLQAQLAREDRRLAELLLDLHRFNKELSDYNACGLFGKQTAVAMTRMQNIRRDILVRTESVIGTMIANARFLDYAGAQSGSVQGRVLTLAGFNTQLIPWSDIKRARELIETVMPEFAVSMTSANAFIENMAHRKDVYIRLFMRRAEDHLKEIKSDQRVQGLVAFTQAVEDFKNAANVDSFDDFLTAVRNFEAENSVPDVKEKIARFRTALEAGRKKFMAARADFDAFKAQVKTFKENVEEDVEDAKRFIGRVTGTVDQYQDQIDALSTAYEAAIDRDAEPRKKLDAIKSAATLLSQYDRRFLAHFSQGEAFVQGVTNDWRKRFDRTACDALSPLVEFIFVTHNAINKGLKSLAQVITETTGGSQQLADDVVSLLKLVLSDKVIAFIEAISLDADTRADGIRAGVMKDTADIKVVWDEFEKVRQLEAQYPQPYHQSTVTQREKAVKAARDLYNQRFANGGPPDLTILKLPDQVNGILDMLSAGDVGQLIDLSKLERALKEALVSFLPTRVNLSYDMGTDISPFPAGEPIFEIGGSGTRFKKDQYGDNENAERDLFIEGRGGIDLVTKEKNFSIKSHIQPFKLNLFPSFEAVTIEFEGVRFTADEGGSDFKVKVKKVEIGPQLAYLQELAKALNPATGPYVEFIFSPLGIEAGFRLSIGSFNLGAMAFSNIALGISCELPLDSREALFRFALSSRSRPFLISVPPYGGGGYFSMKTQATDIVFMAASFEFGGVGDLSFGPLRAQARATTGMYVEKNASRSTTIEGFFIAVGEAQIACFSISTALGVILRHESTGIMRGIAFYSFEFKVSFFKVHYGVTVEKILSGGGGARAALADARPQYVFTRQQVATNTIPYDTKTIDVMAAKTTSIFEDRYKGETVPQRVYRMCKRRKIDINDNLIVACVESRKNWRSYRKTYG